MIKNANFLNQDKIMIRITKNYKNKKMIKFANF